MAKAKAVKKKPAKKPISKKQTTLVDPRQAAFLAAYQDPESKTFANALQSALSAGYSREYAESILVQRPKWLSEYLGNDKRLAKAEAHLDEVLEMPITQQAMGPFGPLYEKTETFVEKTLKNGRKKKVKQIIKKPVMVISTSRIKEKTKVAEIALAALKPDLYGKKADGNKNTFIFNMGPIRDAYRSDPIQVEAKPA